MERQLENRGFFYRFFGRWMKAIDKERQMYPVGVVFGMGFDTATEVLLLTTRRSRAGPGLGNDRASPEGRHRPDEQGVGVPDGIVEFEVALEQLSPRPHQGGDRPPASGPRE